MVEAAWLLVSRLRHVAGALLIVIAALTGAAFSACCVRLWRAVNVWLLVMAGFALFLRAAFAW